MAAHDLKHGCAGSPGRYDCAMLQALRAEDALADCRGGAAAQSRRAGDGPISLYRARGRAPKGGAPGWYALAPPGCGTIDFNIGDPKLAEAWHKAAVGNGGSSIEDPPGVRANGAYLAYLRDPDGNKLVAVALVQPADLARN